MRPYDERLDHLLAQAARVFAERGYHPTTMRDLAAASGMSLAGMYYYVKGKEELLFLVQERCFTRVLEGLLRETAPVESASERSAAAYVLFGMMNWIYNWYDPAGALDPERLADLITRVFIGGFAEARTTVQGG